MIVLRRIVKVLVTALISVVVFLLLAELVTSFTKEGNAVDFVRDPDLILARRPNAAGWSWMVGTARWVPVRINSRRMRDAELPAVRDPGERRILCVGDSFTYGGGLAQEETFPVRMQERFGPVAQSRVRVLNGGANGWTTRFQRIFVEKFADELQRGDVVVLGWNWNDAWAGEAFNEEQAAPFILGDGCEVCRIGAANDFIRSTHLYRFIHQRKHGARVVPGPELMAQQFRNYREKTMDANVRPEERLQIGRERRFGDGPPDHAWWVATDRPAYKMVREEVTTLARFLEGRGIHLLVAMMPEPSWWGPGDLPARERLVELLDSEGVTWMDLHDRFVDPQQLGTRAARREELWQPYDPVHPSQQGQQVIADGICMFLDQLGWSGPPPAGAGNSK